MSPDSWTEIPENTVDPAAERHFSCAQIALLWNVSRDTVRRLFQNEPGVLVLGDTNPRRRKRRYFTLRIPRSVLERVYSRYVLLLYVIL